MSPTPKEFLTVSDRLNTDDYRRLLAVLESVVGAEDLETFCSRLTDALATHLGLHRAITETDLVFVGRLLFNSPTEQSLDTEVVEQPPAPGGRPRGRLILATLRRHLVPVLDSHLAKAGEEIRDRCLTTLTARERQITELVARGLTNRKIAECLFVTVDTVKKHLTGALGKTGCTTRTQLAVLWQRTTIEASRDRGKP